MQIEGPNGNAGWATLPHIPGQVGILIDGTNIACYYSSIKDCRIHSFEKGIWFKGLHATSCFCTHNAIKWCETGIDITDSSGQLQIDGAWIQGDYFSGTTGIRVASTAGGYIYIDHVTSEMRRTDNGHAIAPTSDGTPIACQTLLIETGIGNCYVGKHIVNAYDGAVGWETTAKTIVNNSTQVNHTPLNWGWKNKNFFTIDYDNDLATLHASRRIAIRSGMLYLQGSNANNLIFTLRGNLAGARTAYLPILAADDEITFNDSVQTIKKKTLDFDTANADKNIATNIPDSAIAAHTSTKITITTKAQLNSSLAYIDQANSFQSGFMQTFRNGYFRIWNPTNTYGYVVNTSAITAQRNVTLPVLASDDEFLFKNAGQILDASIAAHTSTKISIANKGQLPSLLAYEDEANIFTEAQKISKSTGSPGITDTLCTLYKPSGGAGDRVSFDFDMNNANSLEFLAASLRVTAASFAAGSESTQMEIWTKNAGTMARRFVINQNGTLNFGTSLRVILTETGLSGAHTYTFVNVDGEIPVRERLTVAAVAGASAFTPATAGFVTIFYDTDTSKLSIKTSTGTIVPLH